MKATDEVASVDSMTPTFDTLKAARELKNTGFEDQQAEAVVNNINTAVNKTVATKVDLALMRKDIEADTESLRKDIESVRKDIESLRKDIESLRKDIESLRRDVIALENKLENKIEAMQNKIVLKIGGLMVTMVFVLLAIGPLYFRWLNFLMN